MRRLVCERLLQFLLRIAIALTLVLYIFVFPIGILFSASFLIVSIFLLAESKAAFQQLHLTVFKLE